GPTDATRLSGSLTTKDARVARRGSELGERTLCASGKYVVSGASIATHQSLFARGFLELRLLARLKHHLADRHGCGHPLIVLPRQAARREVAFPTNARSPSCEHHHQQRRRKDLLQGLGARPSGHLLAWLAPQRRHVGWPDALSRARRFSRDCA